MDQFDHCLVRTVRAPFLPGGISGDCACTSWGRPTGCRGRRLSVRLLGLPRDRWGVYVATHRAVQPVRMLIGLALVVATMVVATFTTTSSASAAVDPCGTGGNAIACENSK